MLSEKVFIEVSGRNKGSRKTFEQAETYLDEAVDQTIKKYGISSAQAQEVIELADANKDWVSKKLLPIEKSVERLDYISRYIENNFLPEIE